MSHPRDTYTVRTMADNGLVDAFLIGPEEICLFEIKSAPLIPFPIQAESLPLTDLDDDSSEPIPIGLHSNVTSQGVDASLIIDSELRIPVGPSQQFKDKEHYDWILSWLQTDDNLSVYLESWVDTFRGYADPGARGPTYWLTNGCGTPNPRPQDWPRRSGSGYETISDPKSSVGLDRTDDVKKGIYQVLKISTHFKEFFPSGSYRIFVALVTNIHAVKHHEGYLAELEDLVWTLDGVDRSYVLERDNGLAIIDSSHLYNLFDALISFTRPHFRDKLLEGLYDFV